MALEDMVDEMVQRFEDSHSLVDERICDLEFQIQRLNKRAYIRNDYDLVLWWRTEKPKKRFISAWDRLQYHKDDSFRYYAITSSETHPIGMLSKASEKELIEKFGLKRIFAK